MEASTSSLLVEECGAVKFACGSWTLMNARLGSVFVDVVIIINLSRRCRRRSIGWCHDRSAISRPMTLSRRSPFSAGAKTAEESDAPPLRVIVLDSTAVDGAAAADATLAAPAATAVSLLALPDAQAEEDGGNEEACPCGPDEAESICADVCATAGALEVVSC